MSLTLMFCCLFSFEEDGAHRDPLVLTHSFPTLRSSALMRGHAEQPLLSVYSPQLAAAQQEYRLADETARRLAASDPASAASMVRLRDAARTRLRNWEISEIGRAHV